MYGGGVHIRCMRWRRERYLTQDLPRIDAIFSETKYIYRTMIDGTPNYCAHTTHTHGWLQTGRKSINLSSRLSYIIKNGNFRRSARFSAFSQAHNFLYDDLLTMLSEERCQLAWFCVFLTPRGKKMNVFSSFFQYNGTSMWKNTEVFVLSAKSNEK